jgi:hypothetical protein
MKKDQFIDAAQSNAPLTKEYSLVLFEVVENLIFKVNCISLTSPFEQACAIGDFSVIIDHVYHNYFIFLVCPRMHQLRKLLFLHFLSSWPKL